MNEDRNPAVTEAELLEMAWGIIANAGWNDTTGDVTEAKTTGWLGAARGWREDYHAWLDKHCQQSETPA